MLSKIVVVALLIALATESHGYPQYEEEDSDVFDDVQNDVETELEFEPVSVDRARALQNLRNLVEETRPKRQFVFEQQPQTLEDIMASIGSMQSDDPAATNSTVASSSQTSVASERAAGLTSVSKKLDDLLAKLEAQTSQEQETVRTFTISNEQKIRILTQEITTEKETLTSKLTEITTKITVRKDILLLIQKVLCELFPCQAECNPPPGCGATTAAAAATTAAAAAGTSAAAAATSAAAAATSAVLTSAIGGTSGPAGTSAAAAATTAAAPAAATSAAGPTAAAATTAVPVIATTAAAQTVAGITSANPPFPTPPTYSPPKAQPGASLPPLRLRPFIIPPETRCKPGLSEECAYPSCAAIKKSSFCAMSNTTCADGVYWIDPNMKEVIDSKPAVTKSSAMKVFCDMTEDGGGWTLLLSLAAKDIAPATLSLWSNDFDTQNGDVQKTGMWKGSLANFDSVREEVGSGRITTFGKGLTTAQMEQIRLQYAWQERDQTMKGANCKTRPSCRLDYRNWDNEPEIAGCCATVGLADGAADPGFALDPREAGWGLNVRKFRCYGAAGKQVTNAPRTGSSPCSDEYLPNGKSWARVYFR